MSTDIACGDNKNCDWSACVTCVYSFKFPIPVEIVDSKDNGKQVSTRHILCHDSRSSSLSTDEISHWALNQFLQQRHLWQDRRTTWHTKCCDGYYHHRHNVTGSDSNLIFMGLSHSLSAHISLSALLDGSLHYSGNSGCWVSFCKTNAIYLSEI